MMTSPQVAKTGGEALLARKPAVVSGIVNVLTASGSRFLTARAEDADHRALDEVRRASTPTQIALVRYGKPSSVLTLGFTLSLVKHGVSRWSSAASPIFGMMLP